MVERAASVPCNGLCWNECDWGSLWVSMNVRLRKMSRQLDHRIRSTLLIGFQESLKSWTTWQDSRNGRHRSTFEKEPGRSQGLSFAEKEGAALRLSVPVLDSMSFKAWVLLISRHYYLTYWSKGRFIRLSAFIIPSCLVISLSISLIGYVTLETQELRQYNPPLVYTSLLHEITNPSFISGLRPRFCKPDGT